MDHGVSEGILYTIFAAKALFKESQGCQIIIIIIIQRDSQNSHELVGTAGIPTSLWLANLGFSSWHSFGRKMNNFLLCNSSSFQAFPKLCFNYLSLTLTGILVILVGMFSLGSAAWDQLLGIFLWKLSFVIRHLGTVAWI